MRSSSLTTSCDLGLAEVVLDRERLELGRLDPAALLARLDQRAGALGLKQFGQLALSQVGIDVLSFLRAVTCRPSRARVPPFERARRRGPFLPRLL